MESCARCAPEIPGQARDDESEGAGKNAPPPLLNPPPHPPRQRLLPHRPTRQRQERLDALRVRCGQHSPIEREEKFGDHQRGAFVAVGEGVVAGEAVSIGRSEGGGVDAVGIGGEVLRAGHGGLEGAFVADAGGAAMFGQLFVVDGASDGGVDPGPVGHFAQVVTWPVRGARPGVGA